MSERTIPLRIADQAVADCEAEIQKLREDNARLKADVEALKLGSLLTAVDVLAFIHIKAEVERLTKAGDAMADWIDHQHDPEGYPFSEAWEKVREGKYKP